MHLLDKESFKKYLESFVFTQDLSTRFIEQAQSITKVEQVQLGDRIIPRYTNEFWTSRQRQAASIHEISYRACFKPQLPRFFMELLTSPGEVVYDPFGGRGTTAVEAALIRRRPVSNDINPLSGIFIQPRLEIPPLQEVTRRLEEIPFDHTLQAERDLSMFYHPKTEGELVSLRRYFQSRRKEGREDATDLWIRMVATNRLTGHSPGFFSVYTLPPNQAVTPERQVKINNQRGQKPPYRDTREIIAKKTRSLLRGISALQKANLREAGRLLLLLEKDARWTPEIPAASVQLTVTSPPFLKVVQYSRDNWLRCWFNAIDPHAIEKKLIMTGSVQEWSAVMGEIFRELYRVTRPGGWVAFEVGEVKNGKVCLDEYVVPLGEEAGFSCTGILVNRQQFTKTSNLWGIRNNTTGTNTNRVVLFYKEC